MAGHAALCMRMSGKWQACYVSQGKCVITHCSWSWTPAPSCLSPLSQASTDHTLSSQDPITASVCLIFSPSISHLVSCTHLCFSAILPSHLNLSLPVPLKAGFSPALKKKRPTELSLRCEVLKLRKRKQGRANGYGDNSKNEGGGSSHLSS